MNHFNLRAAVMVSAAALIAACSPNRNFRKDKPLFESSAVVSKYKSVADMNDAFFVIKENNFFEFYRRLFDSVKNTVYAGKYTRNGDTLLLQFYNKKGQELLGTKAFINPGKKEIIFFDKSAGITRKFSFD